MFNILLICFRYIAKTLDKMKRFDDAISYYALTLELYKREIEAGEEGYHEPALLANIKFRLGWAMVRSRSDIEEGIDWLKEA